MWHQGCFFVPNRFGWMIKGPRWVVLKHVYEVMIAYYYPDIRNPLSISSSRSFIYFFLHDYEAVAWTMQSMQRWFPSTSTGENMRKLLYFWWRYMKLPCQDFSWFLQKKSCILPCSNAFNLFHLTDVKPACTLEPEKRTRSPMFECPVHPLSGDRHSQSHCRSESLYLCSAGATTNGRSCDIGTDW